MRQCDTACRRFIYLVVAVCVVEEDDVRPPEHPGGDAEDLDAAVVGGVPTQLEVVPHHRHPHVRRHDLYRELNLEGVARWQHVQIEKNIQHCFDITFC